MDSIVAPPSIRLWILKHVIGDLMAMGEYGCTPFDPLVDTETRDRCGG